MGNTQSIRKANFEDVQRVISGQNSPDALLINTLPVFEQKCLIKNTIIAENEETIVNNLLKRDKHVLIIVYGKNNYAEDVILKYRKLVSHGFENVFVYAGGLFEWLLLQDIYGNISFPTTSNELDILKFIPISDIRSKKYNLLS